MRLLVGFLSGALLLGAAPGEAAERVYLRQNGPALRALPEADAQPDAEVSRQLRERVQAQGRVRLLVGTRTLFAPEAALDATQRSQQRQDIHKHRQTLLQKLSARTGRPVRALRQFKALPFTVVELDANGLEHLLASGQALSLNEDTVSRPTLIDSTQAVRAPEAWARGLSGQGQAVAIVDTGVDSSHPMLSGKVVAEACFSSAEPGITSSLCPGGATEAIGPGTAQDCASQVRGCGHGTQVASVAAGRVDAGLSGVAAGANIVAVQVYSRMDGIGECGGQAPCALSYASDQIQALEHILALKATVPIAAVNMSLGSGRYSTTATCDQLNQPLKAAIDNLRAAGVATFVSAGNNGYVDSMSAPACISSALSVGSTWAKSGTETQCGASLGVGRDSLSCFSNLSGQTQLLAPGSMIKTARQGGGSGYASGTSLAAPHAAGAWALLRQRWPQLSVDDLLQVLRRSGTLLRDARSGGSVSVPRIDLAAAMNMLESGSLGTLNINLSGTGSVSASPVALSCQGNACVGQGTVGSPVTLVARPASGQVFQGWGGACAGLQAQCSLPLGSASLVQARFGASVSASDAAQYQVQQAYVAYYGRPADPAGLAYWSQRLQAAGGNLASIIQAFGDSAEYRSRSAGLSASQQVTRLYQQLFNRNPDSGGLAYYAGELSSGRRSLQSISLDILNGAQGSDLSVLTNKLDRASQYTAHVAAGCNYGSVDGAAGLLAGVGAAVDSLLQALLGTGSGSSGCTP